MSYQDILEMIKQDLLGTFWGRWMRKFRRAVSGWDNSFVDVSSDQTIVTIKVQLNLGASKKRNTTKRPSNNVDIQNQFTNQSISE